MTRLRRCGLGRSGASSLGCRCGRFGHLGRRRGRAIPSRRRRNLHLARRRPRSAGGRDVETPCLPATTARAKELATLETVRQVLLLDPPLRIVMRIEIGAIGIRARTVTVAQVIGHLATRPVADLGERGVDTRLAGVALRREQHAGRRIIPMPSSSATGARGVQAFKKRHWREGVSKHYRAVPPARKACRQHNNRTRTATCPKGNAGFATPL